MPDDQGVPKAWIEEIPILARTINGPPAGLAGCVKYHGSIDTETEGRIISKDINLPFNGLSTNPVAHMDLVNNASLWYAFEVDDGIGLCPRRSYSG